jgi:hypothetical protein
MVLVGISWEIRFCKKTKLLEVVLDRPFQVLPRCDHPSFDIYLVQASQIGPFPSSVNTIGCDVYLVGSQLHSNDKDHGRRRRPVHCLVMKSIPFSIACLSLQPFESHVAHRIELPD